MGDKVSLTVNEGGGEKVATGAYLNRGTIKRIVDFSNYPGQTEKNTFDSGFEPDICLKVFVEVEGRDNEKELRLFNNFSRDKHTELVNGWRQGAVYHMLALLTDPAIDSDNYSIHPDTLKQLVGKEIAYVRYITPETYENGTKPSYCDWDKIFKGDVSLEEVQEAFAEAVTNYLAKEERNSKYRYFPEAAAKFSNTDFNYRANKEDEKKIDKMKPKDEDMPF